MPADCISSVDGRPFCQVCGVSLPPGAKATKQHLKSITHKKALASGQPPCAPPSSLRGRAEPLSSRDLTAFERMCGSSQGTYLAPPVVLNPRRDASKLDAPFVTARVGAIPVVPDSLDDALAAYFTARKDAHPKVDVNETTVDVCSWGVARRALQAADAVGDRYWSTFFCPEMGHPDWWPKDAKGSGGVGEGPRSAPLFDQIIIGRGPTGIGIHADTHGAHQSHSYVTVCYAALCCAVLC